MFDKFLPFLASGSGECGVVMGPGQHGPAWQGPGGVT